MCGCCLARHGKAFLESKKRHDYHSTRLLRGRVLGDGLGALGHGVLGQLTGEQEADSRLDLAAGDGRLAVVLGQARGLAGNALEQVVDNRVHDAHGLGADAHVGVHLLQHLVDVDAVALLALLAPAAALALRQPSSLPSCWPWAWLASLAVGQARNPKVLSHQ